MSADPELEFLAALGNPESRPSAWAAFLEGWSPLILKVAWRFAGDQDQVLDLYIYVCRRLAEDDCRRFGAFRHGGPGEFTGWLSAVARNLCIDCLRRHQGRRRLPSAIARLDGLTQELFKAIYWEGLPAAEAVTRLGSAPAGPSHEECLAAIARIEASLSPRQLAEMATGRRVEAQAREAAQLEQHADDRADPEASLLARESVAEVARAVAGLWAEDRLLLRLRFEQGLTLAQAGAALGLRDHREASSRLSRILENLRASILARARAAEVRKPGGGSVPIG